MNKITIVTTSSDKYVHLLIEMLDSIKRFKGSKKIDLCLIDYNLSEKNLQKLKKKFNYISKVKKYLNDSDINPFEYIQLFLPKYFPNYQKYIWIDADCWVNSWSAIDMLIKASDRNILAISSMGDRHCPGETIRIDWIYKNFGIIKSQNLKHSLKQGIPIKEARILGLKHHLNAGVFALNKQSSFWKLWINNFRKLRGPSYGRAQLALNYSAYMNDNKINILPNYINCLINSGMAIYDEKKKKFLEKYYPHNEIGIVHLAGKKERFINKKLKFNNKANKNIFTNIRFTK